MRVEGLDAAIARIGEAVEQIEGDARAGLWEAGLKIIGASQKRLTAQIYSKGAKSEDYKLTGNLRASAYVRSATQKVRPDSRNLLANQNEPIPGAALPDIGVELGYTANYALFVHENMQGRGAKFLEGVILENEGDIIRIIKWRTGGE